MKYIERLLHWYDIYGEYYMHVHSTFCINPRHKYQSEGPKIRRLILVSWVGAGRDSEKIMKCFLVYFKAIPLSYV